jgi:truncated hemoglobin YjbI
MSKEKQNTELSTDKALRIADVMHRFYQKIAKDHKVHTDRILLAITDNGKYFQAYVTNEEENQLRYLQDYTIPNGL